jgi:hypothetical protein
MPEAELQMNETPDASLEKKSQDKKSSQAKALGTGQQKPRRPFD